MKKKGILLSACCILLLLAIIVFAILAFAFLSGKDNGVQDSEKRVSEDEIEAQAMKIIQNQEDFISKLIPDKKGFDVEGRLLDLFTPLGAMDPVADEKESENIIAIQNMSFGHFFRKYGFSKERIDYLVDLPLQYAYNDFDYEEYLGENRDVLEKIDRELSLMPEIKVIGIWTSGISRVNDFFEDREQNISWKLVDSKDGFYDFSKVNVYENRTVSAKEVDALYKNMASINITTVYRCEGKSIFIIGAASNNAFGFIRGAESSSEVNCGLLKNRFRIDKDKEANNEWRFWIGK